MFTVLYVSNLFSHCFAISLRLKFFSKSVKQFGLSTVVMFFLLLFLGFKLKYLFWNPSYIVSKSYGKLRYFSIIGSNNDYPLRHKPSIHLG